MLLARIEGRGGAVPLDRLLILGLKASHSCALLRVFITVSAAYIFGLDPMWLSEMALVTVPHITIPVVRVVSKRFSRQESSEMGLKFLGSVRLIWPGLGMGAHFASFHGCGKREC